MTVNGNMPPSLASPSFTLPQGAQQYGDYTQKMAPAKTNHLKGTGSQRGISHTGQRSDNWRSSGHASFSKSKRHPSTMVNPAPAFPRTMTDIPEYLAVQEMAFRQGQYDSGNSRSRVPASPFASLFDQVWERFFQMGAAYGGTPATSPVEPSPTHENFVWSVLINPATQDLAHLNGSVDMGWAHKMCSMSLNCMEELIRVVRNRPKDWEKIVCDIPFPVKQTIVAFPDLCEYYDALQQEANDAFGGGF
ncbi:uncharacterized protein J4E78_009791 [Alternaria triticimaculans]|uniref:uncharacterized protein n=1 Tax=Alternaria triticimaculans TaxID=297637 RepID=UPI0020C401DF|nr:uncharacterized protein J4E78_009791 [Alternaria triticimaculans]KAI4644009.1 hypothetical protein J4E78_009791 [Alternaria triticimaculans]